MSAVERIKQILEERDQQAATAETARLADVKKAEQVHLAREQLVRQKEEARKNFVVSQTEKLLKGSGAFDVFLQIDENILKEKFGYHIVSYQPEHGIATLYWGVGPADKYYIEAKVDPDKEILTIGGQTIYSSDNKNWKEKERVESAIVQAFANPKHYVHIEPPYDYNWGGPYS